MRFLAVRFLKNDRLLVRAAQPITLEGGRQHQPVKLVEIKDMGHQYIFMTPAMLEEQLDIVDDFLKTGCKPGGL